MIEMVNYVNEGAKPSKQHVSRAKTFDLCFAYENVCKV